MALVNQAVIDKAVKLNWNDFEDAIYHEAARAAGCEAIIILIKETLSRLSYKYFLPWHFWITSTGYSMANIMPFLYN